MHMNEKLVEVLKNNKIIYSLWLLKRKRICSNLNKQAEAGALERKHGVEYPQYAKLKKYKNTHLGERCFIIATGPSLTIHDIELLKDEYTFGMNSICKIFDQTTWRPTFYGIQDIFVYKKLEDTIKHQLKSNVFVSDELCKYFHIPEEYTIFPFNPYYHLYEQELGNYFARFSDDSYGIVYDGYSITYSLIQIAVYMGFKEIYLLGVDCSYPVGQKNHFIDSGFVDKKAYLNHDKMIVAYQEAKMYANQHNIQIVNCTRGGMLEVFKRMTLEDVLLKG